MTGRSFALIVAWGVVGCLLILADAPAALRLPIGGSFLILGVGVTLAAALPTVTGLGRYALIVMAGPSAWLLNSTVLVYAGVLSSWPAVGLLALTLVECAIIAVVALAAGPRPEGESTVNLLLSPAFGVPLALLTLTLWLATALSLESQLPRRALTVGATIATVCLVVIVIARFAQVA